MGRDGGSWRQLETVANVLCNAPSLWRWVKRYMATAALGEGTEAVKASRKAGHLTVAWDPTTCIVERNVDIPLSVCLTDGCQCRQSPKIFWARLCSAGGS